MVEFVDQMFQPVVGLAGGGGIEGVGFHQVRAGGQIGIVHTGHQLGAGQQQQVVVALQVHAGAIGRRPGGIKTVGKALAAVVGFRQAMALEHGAHGAIDEQDPPAHGLDQGVGTFGMEPGQDRHVSCGKPAG